MLCIRGVVSRIRPTAIGSEGYSVRGDAENAGEQEPGRVFFFLNLAVRLFATGCIWDGIYKGWREVKLGTFLLHYSDHR